jgi:hypothetical protein
VRTSIPSIDDKLLVLFATGALKHTAVLVAACEFFPKLLLALMVAIPFRII